MKYETPRVVTLAMSEVQNAQMNAFLSDSGCGCCSCQCQCQCQCQGQ